MASRRRPFCLLLLSPGGQIVFQIHGCHADLRRGKLEIHCRDGAALLPRLQAELAAAGLGLDQLEVTRPNLESLYLKITGRALRE
ncbi:hypothetical protein HGA89_04965 [bacterium]|nr:hypothetical protein [bacterium]